MKRYDEMGFATRAIKAGHEVDSSTRSLNTPIYETTNYAFATVKEYHERGIIGGASEFLATKEFYETGINGSTSKEDTPRDYLYSRSTNPTTTALEEKIAALEGTEASLVTACGMGAVSVVLMATLNAGDHCISSNDLFMCTRSMMEDILPSKGIETDLINILDIEELKKTIRPNTKIIYLEVLSNPMLEFADIETISKIAHEKGILVIVDNTFLSPYLLNPIKLGADVVIHSGTKYVVGHGDAMCGLISGPRNLIKYMRYIGDNLGTHISPFSSWLALRGAKTLHVRVQRQCENALAVAKFLESRPEVEKVIYPGLESHPQHELAKRILKNGFGGMITFKIKGGEKEMEHYIDSVNFMPIATSLGDVETLISPKYDHEFFIRMSIGCEDIRDIIKALEEAFDK